MPQRKCAAKRLRVDKTKALRNARIRSELKKETKGFRALVTAGKTEEAKQKLRVVFSKLDRAAAKGVLHQNTAARRKAGLSRKIKSA